MIILSTVEGEARRALNLANLTVEERGNDIVLVRHARCSDGRPAPDLYLRRSDNGVLVKCNVTDRAVSDDQLAGIRAWAQGREFTKREFRNERGKWCLGSISKSEADKMFDRMLRAGSCRNTGQTRNGGELVTMLSDPVLPGHSTAGRPVRPKQPGHSTGRERKNA